MTLGLDKSHVFYANNKRESLKRPFDGMNGMTGAEDTIGSYNHFHHNNSYESFIPPKRPRNTLTAEDNASAIINTQRNQTIIAKGVTKMKDFWGNLFPKKSEPRVMPSEATPHSSHQSNQMLSESNTIATDVYNRREINSNDPFSTRQAFGDTCGHSSTVTSFRDNKSHKKSGRLFSSFRMAEKNQYKRLLDTHLGHKFKFQKPKKAVNRSHVVVDLTQTMSSKSDYKSFQTPQTTPFSVEVLDTKAKTCLIDRIKSHGIAANPTIRLNTTNETPFGVRGYQFSYPSYSTPKSPLFTKSESQKSYSLQSSQTPHPLPETSIQFNALTKQNKNLLDSKWIEDMKNSLNADTERLERDITKSEQNRDQMKAKREKDERLLSPLLLKPITRTELNPFIPYIDINTTFDTEEVEEEDEDEESAPIDMPQLTPEMDNEIDNALESGKNVLLVKHETYGEIYGKDILTLKGLNWLNDEIINFYMSLIVERGKNDNFRTVHAFNTFFYKKIKDNGPQSLKRWTRKLDVFANDYIFIPIHLGMHWCLAVIDLMNKRILYYDSMGGTNMDCVQSLFEWLSCESVDKKKVSLQASEWELEMALNIPQQMNGSDCGMFACKFAEYISRDATITFTQAHMPYFRRRMVYEILNKRLL